MGSTRLRQQAEGCAQLATMVSDPRDRDRLLRAERTLLELAAEQDERRCAPATACSFGQALRA